MLLWDVNTRQVVRDLSLAGFCNGLSFSEDGQTLVTGGETGVIIFWDTAGWQRLGSLEMSKRGVGRLAFSRDGKRLAISAGEGIQLCNPQTRSTLAALWRVDA